ncbi:MAG: glycine cleavage system aminomethyltransferase GcvT, partial [Bacilli bacterium]|nr:glycine cleavage system aminomethyltransferase GcvT [Bacilli bacterium]
MEEVKKTILYDRHIKYNAKMVEFGGFLMPIEYNYLSENGLSFEHMAVRSDCGLFDVSHMGEIYVSGKDTMEYLNYMITSNIEKAPYNRLTYGLFCMENGCVVDDLMVYKYTDDYVLLVVNASNVD